MSCCNPTDRFQNFIGKSPEEAGFFWSGGPVAVDDGTWFASMFSGCTVFDTDEGLVLVDTGLRQMAPSLAGIMRSLTDKPVHTAIYTHGHLDHAFGLGAFLTEGQAPPQIVGHRNMPARFERYERTKGHNQSLNQRQFGGAVSGAAQQTGMSDFGAPIMPPNVLYDDELTLTIGGRRFEIHHCKGETDDHSWVYCPDNGVLCTGDLFIWGVPNAGNPQKAQRYPWLWAAGLRAMAAKNPRTLCPGHGGAVVDDPAKIQRMLLETAEFLEQIVERTLALMEQGSPPHVDVVRGVELPVSSSPWLRPIYDEAEFIVRTVIRFYGGWYGGRPSELKPAPRRAVAEEMVALAGGLEPMLARAQALEERGELVLACHILDYALEAAPGNPTVQRRVAALYEARAVAETSLMAVNLFRSAAAYAREGRPYA